MQDNTNNAEVTIDIPSIDDCVTFEGLVLKCPIYGAKVEYVTFDASHIDRDVQKEVNEYYQENKQIIDDKLIASSYQLAKELY